MDVHATQHLAGYLVDESYQNLSPDVTAKAKLCLQDSLGCFFGGHETPVATLFERLPGYTVGASFVGAKPGPVWQAFYYATLANALDFDDIYWKGHPGATVNAAALAVASQIGSTGQELIVAIVTGYEVGCRVAMSILHKAPRKTVHGHGTWQTFGAAAAAAKLLQLNRKQAAEALAIAAVNAPVASVMKTVYGAAPTMAKNNFATAAMVGVNAAYLARAGFEGPLDVFEGETGFWRMAGADGLDPSRLVALPGGRYEIQDVGFKAYSCCRIIQSSIEAVIKAFDIAATGRDGRDVREIRIIGPEILCRPPFSNPEPADIWAAQFSAPFSIAMALLGHAPGPEWFRPFRLKDKSVRDLTAKIGVRSKTENDQNHGHHAVEVTLFLIDGSIIQTRVDVARGDAANPLDQAFLDEKFLRLSASRLPRDEALEMLRFVKRLDLEDDLTVLWGAVNV